MTQGIFYLDSSQASPLWLAGEGQPRLLATRLNVQELLTARGWDVLGAVVLRKPLPQGMTPPWEGMLAWVRGLVDQKHAETIGDLTRISVGGGDRLAYELANELLRTGRLGEAWLHVKVAPRGWMANEAGAEQDLDLAWTSRNTLVAAECKLVREVDAESILKVAQVARRVGGRKTIPLFVYVSSLSKRGGLARKADAHEVGLVRWNRANSGRIMGELDRRMRQ